MFAENVRWVEPPRDEREYNHARCDRLSYTVVRLHDVALVQFAMRGSCAVDNRLVVPEHIAPIFNWNTHIAQCVADIDDLLHTRPGRNELGTIDRCFDCRLLLRKPISWGLVHEMKGCCDGLTSKHIMEQACVTVMSRYYCFT